MVTTRGQSGIAKPKSGIEKLKKRESGHVKSVVQAKVPQSPKTVVQKRRHALAHAPQLGNHVLFLFLGPQRELVTIHSDLIPESTKAYINERSQGQQAYQLPDEPVEIFQIYRLFLYTGGIFSVSARDQDQPDNGRSKVHDDSEWTKLAYCYLFGLTVRDEKFANASISAIIEKMIEVDRYPTGIASEVYDLTKDGDELRKLLTDIHVWRGQGTWLKPPHGDADAPKEFLQDVITGLVKAGSELYEDVAMPWVKNGCVYHSHQVTDRCGA